MPQDETGDREPMRQTGLVIGDGREGIEPVAREREEAVEMRLEMPEQAAGR